ncbi:aquaporin-11-like [Gouania willdenowi]|uniref:Aquaporin n=1 Tax=Gouania willdenowi TaxID=441366 RepID=A0A8C5HNJ7_GOUWI|nr:aquaporin-11-like [Gouania willdenowi]
MVDVTDVTVSLLMLAGLVAVCEAVRVVSGSELHADISELVSTFQQCCCTHELRLLSEVGGIEPRLALTLTYLAALVHALTFRGATGNPTGTLEHVYRARLTRGCALRRVACQFAAALLARFAVHAMRGLGLSGLHAHHAGLGFQCTSNIHASLPWAALVELACAFAVQTVTSCTRTMEEKYRVHALAATITAVGYTGGGVSGAVFNPALAFSTQFHCSGNSMLDYCLVYWVGPLLGMMASVLLIDKLRPSPSPHLHGDTKKTS